MTRYNNYTGDDLTFVVCAYKECEYLEESIVSLMTQTVRSKVLISTSTPNSHINGIAEKYDIEVRINPDGGQIKDYNFAIRQADTPLVMLSHQDDVLSKSFAEDVINAFNLYKDPIIAFTDYIEIHDDIEDNAQSSMVRIKKMLLLPAKCRWLMGTVFGKRLVQRFGNPITHPSVVCVKSKLPDEVFKEEYKACMDWDLWERLSRVSGSFVYVDKVLLHHRMNDTNQSSVLINSTTDRFDEELVILKRFWPGIIARFIMRFYSKGHNFYK